jgi:hypothetical protein
LRITLSLDRKDGLIWQSAGKNIENMNQWFTANDALNLYNQYVFKKKITDEELENFINFILESCKISGIADPGFIQYKKPDYAKEQAVKSISRY